MAYTRKCSRCGGVFERGIPTLRVVTYDRENVPLCDECTEDLRWFLKGASVIPANVNPALPPVPPFDVTETNHNIGVTFKY